MRSLVVWPNGKRHSAVSVDTSELDANCEISMQHGFTVRNGLTAAILASKGYTGIEHVLERDFGGFLKAFNQGVTDDEAKAKGIARITADLGSRWEIDDIIVKAYAAMGGLHCAIDCARNLQRDHASLAVGTLTVDQVQSIKIEMAEAAYKHGGWKVDTWPMEPMGAQMSAAYVVAVQLTDGAVMSNSYGPSKIGRPELKSMIDKTQCSPSANLADLTTRVTITLIDGKEFATTVVNPRGTDPLLSLAEIVDKFDGLTKDIAEASRLDAVKRIVLDLENQGGVEELVKNLQGSTISVL